MTGTDPYSFRHWDLLLETEPVLRRQVEHDLAVGRFRMLDPASSRTCQEVYPTEGRLEVCDFTAVLHDGRRGRDQCVIHASVSAEERARGFGEFPLWEAP